MYTLIASFLTVAFFLWAVLGHPTHEERQRMLDQVCVKTKKTAVCNPTGVNWR